VTRNLRRILFTLFFISGFCGLLYQVVWLRLCLASFGVITPVLSVVVSVFMLGLFAGSWAAGRLAQPLAARLGVSAAWLYAAAELVVAVGAVAVPRLLSTGETVLLSSGSADSAGYLLLSALIIAGAIFPWCVAMGATFPCMMAFVREKDRTQSESFSFLYLANVIGAMVGTLVTPLILVELLGFRNTLLVAGALNLLVAAVALALGAGGARAASSRAGAPAHKPLTGARFRAAECILFLTGFTSMAMEVIWTRAFTPVLKTQVYSFATLMCAYFLATWLGSYSYRRHLARGATAVPTARLLAWLALSSFLPVLLNDPRLHLKAGGALLSIAPFCALLGYLTPKLIDRCSGGDPDAAGRSYAVNVLGCILGPLFASYLLLPWSGVKLALLLLAIPYALMFAWYLPSKALRTARPAFGAALAVLALACVPSRTYEDQVAGFNGSNGEVRRDYVATVISYGSGVEKRLLVNGIGITHLTTATKVMAHLPLSLLPNEPRSALVICFGMGTTYRALMSWGIDVTAVELVPSVKDAFPYYFADAAALTANPKSHIVVDDGRRWLRRTTETYDLITLDPPPPPEAAGSSLLYSEAFYAAAKSKLKPGGILQQWMPGAEDKITRAAARSIASAFPYVRVYHNYEGDGYHFLASMTPIPERNAAELARRMPEAARRDLLEWTSYKSALPFVEEILSHRLELETLTAGGDVRITDDRPFNEYFVLRRNLPLVRRFFTGS
jgi:spermidine synthase